MNLPWAPSMDGISTIIPAVKQTAAADFLLLMVKKMLEGTVGDDRNPLLQTSNNPHSLMSKQTIPCNRYIEQGCDPTR